MWQEITHRNRWMELKEIILGHRMCQNIYTLNKFLSFCHFSFVSISFFAQKLDGWIFNNNIIVPNSWSNLMQSTNTCIQKFALNIRIFWEEKKSEMTSSQYFICLGQTKIRNVASSVEQNKHAILNAGLCFIQLRNRNIAQMHALHATTKNMKNPFRVLYLSLVLYCSCKCNLLLANIKYSRYWQYNLIKNTITWNNNKKKKTVF